MSENCENCKFGAEIIEDEMFDSLTAETFVLCHRYPPRPYTLPTRKKGRQAMWGWAIVGKKEWCGEYKPKDAQRE